MRSGRNIPTLETRLRWFASQPSCRGSVSSRQLVCRAPNPFPARDGVEALPIDALLA
jgi:hypothetical protein